MEVKRCPKCGMIKGLSEFYNNGYCRECQKAYHKQWRKNNKARIKEYSKQWSENNKAHIKEYYKQWRENNEEYHKQRCKKWRDDNRGYYLYIIRNSEEVQYVGVTELLSGRLNSHINCKSNIKDLMQSDNWTEIKYLDITNVVANREEMLLLENVLIDLYKPMYNKNMNVIKNVDKLREFSLVAEVHDLNKQWKLYCKNKKDYLRLPS